MSDSTFTNRVRIGLLAAFLLVIGVIAFSRGSTPSAADAEVFLAAKIKKDSENLIRLISLTKTDGQSSAVDGVKTYRLSFEATMDFRENCLWGTFSGSKWFGDFHAVRFSHPLLHMEKRRGMQRDIVCFRGVIQFQKTERGWQGAFDRNTAEIL